MIKEKVSIAGGLMVATVLCGAAVAQPQAMQAIQIQDAQIQAPRRARTNLGSVPMQRRPFSLDSLMKVKLDEADDGPRFICMANRFTTDIREVQVTRMVAEQREQTYTVIDDNGEAIEKTRQVQAMIPVTETVKQEVSVPRGKKPTLIPWEKAKVFRLDGSQLTLDEAKQALKMLRTVLVHSQPDAPLSEADKLLLDVLQPDTLVFSTSQLDLPGRVGPNRINIQRLVPAGFIPPQPNVPPQLPAARP